MRFTLRSLATSAALLLVTALAACSSSDNKKMEEPDAPVDEGSCFDGRQDGNEEGVDCGGRCDMQCVQAGCGNGIVEAGEQCDDHNTNSGDGCDANCTVTGCGNGVITGAEVCDDGNTSANDGCDDMCKPEAGFDCVAGPAGGPATVCTPHCGDGMILGTETCDDGNDDPTDGCNMCQLDAGCAAGETAVIVRNGTQVAIPDDDVVTGVTSTVDIASGGAITKLSVIANVTHMYDSDVVLALQGPTGITRTLTDDHGSSGDNYVNTRFDDGATATLASGSAPFNGSYQPDQSLSTTQGVDFKGGKAMGTWTLHAYDDGSGDTGTLDSWTLLACVDATAGYCGDGHVDAGEECDDGNTDETDGCKSSCKQACGDGILDPAEQCDDGNHASGDGCSAACVFDCPTGSTLVTVDNTTSVAIPKTSDVSSINHIATTGAVTGLRVKIGSLPFMYGDDLKLSLVGPRGGERMLSNLHGSGANFTNTLFVDNATKTIASGASPFTGSFKPDASMATTAGTDFLHTGAAGDWKLRVQNISSTYTGSLDSWSLYACVDTTLGYCGDSHVDAGEECDDGNTSDTDACKTNCKLPCGDGVLDAGEVCDDGNHANGDGCSSACVYDCPAGSTLATGTNATAMPIPDGDATGITSTIPLTTAGAITSVRVTIGNLTHTYDADVDMYLVGPDGTTRELSTDNGSSNDNYINTVFVDGAATSITAGAAPFTGTFKPETSMATTAGTDLYHRKANGTWSLHVIDDGSGATGTLNSWSVAVCVDPTIGYCGDGHVDTGEACDDGNASNDDACTNACKLPCGDGILEGTEQCDDGNVTAGDGCSGTCTLEIACPAGSTLQVASNNTKYHIVDDTPSGVDSPVTIAGAGNVQKVVVFVNQLTHAYDGDVVLKLVGPTAVSRTLSDQNGSNGDNYTKTRFEDGAATTIASGTAPFTGTFKPDSSMATTAGTDFLGTAAAGTWKLNAADVAAIIDGDLNSWTLAVCVGP